MSESATLPSSPAQSPPGSGSGSGSDVSPGTNKPAAPTEYFAPRNGNGDQKAEGNSSSDPAAVEARTIKGAKDETAKTSPADDDDASSDSDSSELTVCDTSRRVSLSKDPVAAISRKSSSTSVSFRPPRNPHLPQGHTRKTDAKRLRASSPTPVKFQHHVGFDNLPVGESTKHNTSSFTLNVRHQGYHPNRRSRTFMVGVDENAYSDYALVWLLTKLVDDGDEVVCVRVTESPRLSGRDYQGVAQKLLESIQAKNEHNKAISIVLEYSMGKLHTTFQQMIQLYQPSMLIVGTRGRSLGGIQGLVNTRNSFSKYCLQYSPVPVVVVRPDEKRKKKKDKRVQDPSRHSYAQMLANNNGKHEADSETSSLYGYESNISPDEEAHRVAAAIGLPAAFDPTIKPYKPEGGRRRSSPSLALSSPALSNTSRRSSDQPSPLGQPDSDEEESGDEDEFVVEAVSGSSLSREEAREQEIEKSRKQKLHVMEMNEAAALLRAKEKKSEEDDDEDESPGGGGGVGSSRSAS